MATLFISYKYPPSLGGMQKQSYELIQGYSKERQAHALIHDQKGSVLFFFVSLLWRVPLLLRRQPDISTIHFNDGVCALCCIWMRLYWSMSLVVTYHGLDLVFPNVIYQKLLLPLLHSLDAVIAVSLATKEACVERGFDPDRIIVVPNGVDAEVIIDEEAVHPQAVAEISNLQADNKKIITAIGRPVKRKGFVWFVEEVLPQLDPSYLFVLIGPYPEMAEKQERWLRLLPKGLRRQVELCFGLSTEHELLRRAASLPEYKDRFLWYQNLNHDSKNWVLEASTAFVMPNVKVPGDMEGFGLVALEANMLNTPVIAARLEGITTAVTHGKNGLLLESEDAASWIEVLNDFSASSLSYSCKYYAKQNYSWTTMVQGYGRAFDHILKQKQGHEKSTSRVFF